MSKDTNDMNNATEPNQDELRARLMELKDQHEAIEREMDAIQDRMGEDGDAADETLPDPTDELRVQVEEWKNKYQRALADYQNFQQRSMKNEAEARRQGVVSVAESLMTVLDNFDLALAGDPSKLTAESVLKGIVVTRDELLRVLGTHGVKVIDPNPGDEFSPMHHEAVMQQASDDVAPGAVVTSLQKGYALGERTLRPAKVSVKPQADTTPPPAPTEEADDADV
ncbi:MAG: nucleotide exchange factor GrpE [Phycisphaerales bacterium]